MKYTTDATKSKKKKKKKKISAHVGRKSFKGRGKIDTRDQLMKGKVGCRRAEPSPREMSKITERCQMSLQGRKHSDNPANETHSWTRGRHRQRAHWWQNWLRSSSNGASDAADTRHHYIITTRCAHRKPAPTSWSRRSPAGPKVIVPQRSRITPCTR